MSDLCIFNELFDTGLAQRVDWTGCRRHSESGVSVSGCPTYNNGGPEKYRDGCRWETVFDCFESSKRNILFCFFKGFSFIAEKFSVMFLIKKSSDHFALGKFDKKCHIEEFILKSFDCRLWCYRLSRYFDKFETLLRSPLKLWRVQM